MPARCKNEDLGCDVTTHRDHIDAHEAVCDFRLVCCVDIACHGMFWNLCGRYFCHELEFQIFDQPEYRSAR